MIPKQSREARPHASAHAWHAFDLGRICRDLRCDPERGLSDAEASARLASLGANEITERARHGWMSVLLRQFADTLIAVLIAAALVSWVLGEWVDAVAILAIVAINALIGAAQQVRAERTIAALKKMAAHTARVCRQERMLELPARELVPGDLVSIEAGDMVPADLRLLATSGLSIDESKLTGESVTAGKSAEAGCAPDAPLAERPNLAYKDTQVTRGRGTGIVVATGDATEIGRIAHLLEDADTATPLQRRLAHFGRQLALVILAICAALFALGLAQGQPALLMFMTAVSLAVAAVPEALPAVVTISLAIGAGRLASRKALVRKLPAVETLGSVSYICADKTGTLTENRMRSAAWWLDSGPASAPADMLSSAPPWPRIATVLALNNDVTCRADGHAGDPTEVALLEAALSAGVELERLQHELPRRADIAFDEHRKLMTTLHSEAGGTLALVKGAPEAVLARCTTALGPGGPRPFDATAAGEAADALAAEGYRVLALASRELADEPGRVEADTTERGLTFLALVGLVDPPRPEAKAAVGECRAAGIEPVMITGDHPATARHIAEQLGIAAPGAPLLTGRELAGLDDAALDARIHDVNVYARVSPEQKIRIVAALQRRGEFAAMTGDGVNDAPALKRADIGIAMGERGTDVAREASDMILLDDNFATIVAAVAEGRRVFDDIKKFVRYTMTSNAGEICTLVVAPLLGLPLPLLPIHILWVNLLTDGFPGLAFSAEPAERDVMRRPPRPPDEPVLGREQWVDVAWIGLLIGALTIGVQWWELERGASYWQTVTFTTLVVAQLWNALALRSPKRTLWEIGALGNPALLAALALTVCAQLAVIYVPALNVIFHTEPLPLMDLTLCFALGACVWVAGETRKLLRRLRHRSPEPAR